MPCCGRGKVYALEGGTRRELPCPWCEGTGIRKEGLDAQARWKTEGAAPDRPDPGADS